MSQVVSRSTGQDLLGELISLIDRKIAQTPTARLNLTWETRQLIAVSAGFLTTNKKSGINAERIKELKALILKAVPRGQHPDTFRLGLCFDIQEEIYTALVKANILLPTRTTWDQPFDSEAGDSDQNGLLEEDVHA